ncbi:Fatty-acyl-CoA reductase [Operophtera brumata]|uniref:Fatty acyl-CoA reductase n=1 Tax=Operophtera brumata TaxID=104452 RepID=A0A0L7LEG4_OPEBR|nr:Fatty-acyl-CoA reductase [Operophtera brumata]
MIKTAACVIFLLAIVVKSDEDYIDPVIEMLLNGVRTEITQSGEDLNERVPVSTGGIWKCGNCTFLGEAELLPRDRQHIRVDTRPQRAECGAENTKTDQNTNLQVLLEKLLYSCPGIDNIYVLIRDHKGLSAGQRIQKLIDNPLFARLKEQRPYDLKKLIPVCGDVGLPNLGISRQDEQILIEKALAETLVEKHHGQIPTIIVRPSIVPGWICNWNGASGLVTSAAKGLTRIVYGDPKAVLDLIPVDYVSNLIIAAAAKSNSYVKLQNMLTQNRDALSYFTSHSWLMRTNGTRALAASLSPADCRQFPCRPQDINWREYIPVYWAGIRKFIEKKSF